MTNQPFGRSRQDEIYRAGVSGTRPAVPTNWQELEAKARRAMSRKAEAYVEGGAGAGSTMANNRRAFDARHIVPRMLCDVAQRDLTVELFGRRLSSPLLLAPIGASEMVHPDADAAVAQAAAATSVPMVFSNQASRSMEDCAAVMGDSPRWFQLYWSTNRDLISSFLRRAEAAGCEALVLTLDTTMLGWRSLDLDLGWLPFIHGWGIAQYTSDPVFLELVRQRVENPGPAKSKPRITPAAIRTLVDMSKSAPGTLLGNLRSPYPLAAIETFLEIYSNPSVTWNDLAWLRTQTKLPIVLKGILHEEDARLAVEHGVDGLIVSNHGGRQIEGATATLDALPGITEAVGGKLALLLDSGIRSGADIFKAVNLGADAVLLGRPVMRGLAINGSSGVQDAIRNILADFDLTTGLAGCASISDIRAATVR